MGNLLWWMLALIRMAFTNPLGRGWAVLLSSSCRPLPEHLHFPIHCTCAADGHVVTNYHVLASVLSGAAGKVQPSALVARVLLLNRDGVQQAFDGFLVGKKNAVAAATRLPPLLLLLLLLTVVG